MGVGPGSTEIVYPMPPKTADWLVWPVYDTMMLAVA
jgi:hypothetical protein